MTQVSHISKLLFGLIVFKEVFQNPDQDDETLRNNRIQYSKLFCVVDSISTIILHGLLFLVSYIWIRNILGCVLDPANPNSQKNIKISIYSSLIRWVKRYMFIRYAIYAGCFITQIIAKRQQQAQLFCSIINIIIIVQSFMSLSLSFVCLNILLNNLDYLQLQTNKQKAQLLKQFILVTFFCLMRFFINLFFLQLNNVSCQFNQIDSTQLKHTIIYLAMGIITTHFIPILLVFRIFKINLKQIQNMSVYQKKQIQTVNEQTQGDCYTIITGNNSDIQKNSIYNSIFGN